MNRLAFVRLACACLLAVAFGGRASAADSADAAELRRQVMVMLRIAPAHFRPDGNYANAYDDAAGRSARRRIAAALARRHGLTMLTDWPMPLLGIDCYVMGAESEAAAQSVAEELARDPRVSWVQAMNVYEAKGHVDPLFAMQPAAREWHLDELHGVATGRDIRVAIVDSGIETAHPDLAGRVVVDEDFAEGHARIAESHGTAVAGIIGARADNGVGIVGVAPDAKLMALRACWQETGGATLCSSLTLALALQAAVVHRAQVINVSVGGPADRLLEKLLDLAIAQGIVVVAAADPASVGGGFPARHRGVVAVADAGDAGATGITIGAPGRDVPATLPGAKWGLVSGSSFAAAHVSGLFSLLLELRSRSAATTLPRPGGDLVLDPQRRIDACETVRRSARSCVCECATFAPSQAAMRN